MLETKIRTNCFNPDDHNPKVNKKSKKLAGKREGKIEDRLLKLGKEMKDNLKKKRKKAIEGMFNPTIGNRSKEIVEKKKNGQEERLVKHMTGKKGRTDYYETIHTNGVEALSSMSSLDGYGGKPFAADPM